MVGWTDFAWMLGIVGLAFALGLFWYVKKQPRGNERMQELEGLIHDGAMAFLKREYSTLVIFIVIVFALLAWKINPFTLDA